MLLNKKELGLSYFRRDVYDVGKLRNFLIFFMCKIGIVIKFFYGLL